MKIKNSPKETELEYSEMMLKPLEYLVKSGDIIYSSTDLKNKILFSLGKNSLPEIITNF